MKERRACYLCGPTAVGKSAVAIELAQLLRGEIISVDSMQVYRGMDIGTGKASAVERSRAAHHLIDVADLSQSFDAAQFVELARNAEGEIRARGHVPIFCGGTGLYFNALLQGLGEGPPSDPKVRAELSALPLEELLLELKARDLKSWESIDRLNLRRVVRAVEVIRLTGRPFSELRTEWAAIAPDQTIIGLEMDRSDLNNRIDLRVEEMFARGLVAETRELLARGLRENRTASQALGYKQVIEHLDGQLSLAETVELVKTRTRQFAKRQMTWFRRQLTARWMTILPAEKPAEIARRLIEENKFV